MRDILVTSALPYANGPIHLGHLVEAIQTDIWVRFQRLRGNRCLYICGDDAHGTAIMLAAKKLEITPEDLIAKVHREHLQDFTNFLIEFDNFYTTHSAENRELASQIYLQLWENGDISQKNVQQAYDPKLNIFLPDRYIKGTCPRCKAENQYGDNCEICGSTYNATDLIDAISAVSGAKPIEKSSEHFFFDIDNYRAPVFEWIEKGHLQPQVANKLKEWFGDKLRAWDITRDAPYFGFKIPNTENKYFYVWLDAPVGYMASLKNLCARRPELSFDHYWKKDSTTELYHFVGKDIVYFHALFWPAMLYGTHFRLPTNIFVHGYLTINGEKMSKSRGTFITASQYLQHLEPEFFRYYIAAKLSTQIEDIDLNFADFALRTNADLVGKYINLASRCAGFIEKKFNGELGSELDDPILFQRFVNESENIAKYFENLNYNKAIREIMQLADLANQYIDQQKPWSLAKENGTEAKIQAVCTQGINLFKILTTYLKPILPRTAEKVESFLNIAPLEWKSIAEPLLNHKINKFTPLMQRVTSEQIGALAQISV